MWMIIKPMRLVYGLRPCEYENQHILTELKGKTFIAVSNHIKPRNKFLRLISMPYDAFMIRHFMKQHGIYATAMTSYDAGKRVKGAKKLRPGQVRKEQLIKGIVKSMDLIPLNRNENDPSTIQEIRRRIAKGNLALGIFPEGTYFRGFRKNRKLHGGMAVLSKRYNLPIVTFYIDSYNMNKKSRISVGNPIWEPMEANQVIEIVRNEMIRLKERKQVDVGDFTSIEEENQHTSV
ncbi:lysophospholipid acyltransferase family protein [Leptospira ryugenii]|nr:1-acyl-sn-glycerol-3-phosphate acyltransferase [Leptospira ryugenii]